MSDIIKLADRVRDADGVDPLNEANRIAIASEVNPRVLERVDVGGTLVAAAYAAGDAHIEVFVAPEARRQGRGRTLISALLERGEGSYWAHGDLAPAQACAQSLGLAPHRTLLILSRSASEPLPEEIPVEGITIRTWNSGDAEALVAVNARAFAAHPEQGAMDLADLRARMSQDWFDPGGLFIAERAGRVVGFHWTKIADGIGEVYVVGVDPSAQGIGLGHALTLCGLHHLVDAGVERIDLYVEGDNSVALATYRGLGFTETNRDVVYAR